MFMSCVFFAVPIPKKQQCYVGVFQHWCLSTFPGYCWWFRNPANHLRLRLVVYLIIYRVLAPLRAVSRISSINSIAQKKTGHEPLYYQPKQCTIIREIPQNDHRFEAFDLPNMGNLMTTAGPSIVELSHSKLSRRVLELCARRVTSCGRAATRVMAGNKKKRVEDVQPLMTSKLFQQFSIWKNETCILMFVSLHHASSFFVWRKHNSYPTYNTLILNCQFCKVVDKCWQYYSCLLFISHTRNHSLY